MANGGPWVRLDADFWQHPKVVRAGNAAAGVYARALTYCGSYLTDGFVPAAVARIIATASERRKVTEARLWLEVVAGEVVELLDGTAFVAPDDGYYIPDYTNHNPSKEDMNALRRARSEAGREGARKRWQTS